MSATDLYGLTALPASVGALKPSNTAPNTVSSSSLSPPDTPLAKRVQAYVKAQLNPDPREFKDVRWFDADERDWPTGPYDPEMHRFAAKLKAAQRAGGGKVK